MSNKKSDKPTFISLEVCSKCISPRVFRRVIGWCDVNTDTVDPALFEHDKDTLFWCENCNHKSDRVDTINIPRATLETLL